MVRLEFQRVTKKARSMPSETGLKRRHHGRRIPFQCPAIEVIQGILRAEEAVFPRAAQRLRGHSIEKEVDYSPRHLPAGFSEIDLLVEVVRGQHGHADVRTDVELVWYPRRSAAEHLTAGHFRSVTINAVIYGKGVRYEHRTFRQRAIIDKLTRVLNSAPASPGGWESCPLILETYTLTFTPVKGEAGAKVQVPGCFQYGVTVGGHSEPPLTDTGKVENIAHRLLKHQTPNPVVSSTPPPPAE